jgi:two-component system sensor histidine kinase MtrB
MRWWRHRAGTRRWRSWLRGLRPRLVVAFLLVALGSGAATAVISYVSARNTLVQNTQDQVMEEFLARVQEIARESPHLGAESIGTFSRGITEANLVIYRDPETGEEVAQHQGDWTGWVTPELRELVGHGTRVFFQRTIEQGEPYLYVGTAVLVDQEPSGIEVYQRVPQAAHQEGLDDLLGGVAGALAVAGGAALVLALLAARSVLRPVRALSRGARRLGAGELDTRLPVRGADEMTELVVSFNSAAAALERSVTRLRHEEASSRRFVADVSHELRTPLTAMTAVTETLDGEAARLGGDGAAAARVLSAETHRLAHLVENLIEISRFDAGQATLVLEDVDLAEVVQGALRARGWSERVEVRTVLGDGRHEVVVTADPRRLDVIISNLVGNALRHGAAPVTVTAFGRAADDTVGVSVRDSGPGLDAEVVSHVFERFYKADPARSRSEGSGLGLAIAWENARLHGGTIELSTAPGAGTTFTLILPARSDQVDVSETAANVDPPNRERVGES